LNYALKSAKLELRGPYFAGLLLLLVPAGLQFAFLVLAPLSFAEGGDRADDPLDVRKSQGE